MSRASLRAWRDDRSPSSGNGECPRCEDRELDEPAYAALLGYYLGDGCLSEYPRYVALRISCDAALPRVIADVRTALERVRPGMKVFSVRAPGTVVVQAHWQHWPCLFPQHGPGRKHERSIALQSWQREAVEQHAGDFLRGLFHSDGSRTRNWASRVVAGERKRYDYPRWEFVNRSDDILGLCTWALDLCDIAWRRSKATTVSVSRRDDVLRLDALIGPKS